MVNKPMMAVAAVVLTAALAAFYYLRVHNAQPASPPAAVQPAAPAEPAVLHPLPSAGEADGGPLPALADSDPPMREALAAVAGADAIARFLVPENIIRHLVVTIDNLPRAKVPAAKRPTVAVPGTFMAVGDELHSTLDPKNYARYEPMVAVVRALDMRRVAQVYLHFYPLFQGAYQDLGYPGRYFNDRLVEAIDSLLAAPQAAGAIQLTRPNVLYTFADPALEGRPAGQKILLRMGPDNAAVIKAKLTELRAIITAAPPSRH